MMKTLILFLCLAFQAPAALAAPDHDCPCMKTQTCEMDMQNDNNARAVAPLDEGIREVVALVRELGFVTTDSGDGRSKPAEARVFDFPHVVMVTQPDRLIDHSRGLAEQLEQCGVEVTAQGDSTGAGVWIQATFDPRSEVGVIMLGGLNDEGLREARRVARERGRRDASIIMRIITHPPDGYALDTPEQVLDRAILAGGLFPKADLS